ncbi:GGDEF domain-containing protein [Williamsia maris]|uniref:Diguanylate cyclase (GGDEF) domain-containing protein n=1 Tax=Williamsia maris TaxID=72806 RepID=A0ABT1HHX3_9NOCA|nr:GGDEF domain-containing protein [Williamsia maris]MCP2176641.1 diguanylate cyclase (GGDEF) domain-containing protein [Williamsia maris]
MSDRRLSRQDILGGGSSPEPVLRIGIAVQTIAFGLIGILSTFSDAGPQGTVRTMIVYVVCATTVPAAVVISRARFIDEWWTRTSRVNNGFIVYAEVGVTAVLLTFADASVAIVGAGLLALVGACAAHFSNPLVLRFHVLWSTATVLGLATHALIDGVEDPAALVLQAVVVILVMNGAVFLLSAFSAAILASSRLHLSDAVTDPLTGLLNRRGIESHAAGGFGVGHTTPFLVLIDIDDFKQVNDTHGHAAGDDVLRLVAVRLTVAAGPGAVVSRFGGEEFVVLADEASPDLFGYAERLRTSLTNERDAVVVTASAGACAPRPDRSDPSAAFAGALAAADAAMYRAKSSGRNRTELA